MIELANMFTALPSDYQKVLRLAQDTHKIKITPLQQLKGGQTGANLFLASVSGIESKQVQHLVLKLDHKNTNAKMDELERHSIAVKEAPKEFARDHIPQLSYNRIEHENSIAIFYNIAGQSLHNYKPLSSYQQQNKIEKIFRTTNNILLNQWNANPLFEQAVHPQKILSTWLGYRLKQGGNIDKFLRDSCRVSQDTNGLLIQENVFPNPLLYARSDELWEDVRPIDILTGFQHGDLNIANILVRFNGDNEELEGYYLIDFALFKQNMPLFYDNLYLQMSYLVRELTRVSFKGWTDLVTQFTERDILDADKVPVELAGTCAVINAARTGFSDWLNTFHSSLSDDLWGQYQLAAVAVGLNFCNKTGISDSERLAGLIFAASHLKRYHRMFGVSPPREVKHINITGTDTQELTSQTGKSAGQRSADRNINLPAQTTPFIGRVKEIKAINAFFRREDLRLLTLTGPGGTGKTRLAIHLATLLTDQFEDGIYFIDLAPVRDPESLFTAIARTIGLKEKTDQPLIDELGRQLQTKKLMLLLDNLEQLTAAAPRIVELMNNCPLLKLLVTSREALHIRGEQVFPVSPLSLPKVDPKNQSGEQVIQFESVQLFVERASAVRPDFEITNENAKVIAGICSRLDGLPLAIELAAARISLFSPGDLLKRLDSRLKLLRGGARDLPLRQQTLEDTIGWSYELLNDAEQRLFSLFSVFHGCTIEDVEAIAGGIKQIDETQTDILSVLTSLVDKSLIRRTGPDDGKPRLFMLETIRDYAFERLAGDQEFNTTVRHKHATYYANFSQQQWKRLNSNERQAALKEFETDIENVQAAWNYWVSASDFDQLQKLTDCLWLLFNARGWYSAIVELTTDLLKVLTSTPSTTERARQEIMLQTSLGRVLMAIKGCTPEVEEIYKRALELCKKYGEIPKSFPILRALASFYVYLGELEKSKDFGKQILNLGEKLNDINIQVEGNLLLGYSLAFTGDILNGLKYLEKAVAIFKPDLGKSYSFKFGNNPGIISYTTSALCSWMLGYFDRSIEFTDRALVLADKLDHPSSKIYALFHTGLLRQFRRESEIALKHADEGLEIADNREFQVWKAVLTCLHGAALAATGHADDGKTEFNLGLNLYSELKTPPIFWPMLLLLKAVVYAQAGEPNKALDIIDEAFKAIGESTGNPLLSELYRLKGDVLLMVSTDMFSQAEDLFKRALQIARQYKTTTFELRAAVSLCKLWTGKNKREESRRILSEACEKFTEGFNTTDLIEAKDLLSELS